MGDKRDSMTKRKENDMVWGQGKFIQKNVQKRFSNPFLIVPFVILNLDKGLAPPTRHNHGMLQNS